MKIKVKEASSIKRNQINPKKGVLLLSFLFLHFLLLAQLNHSFMLDSSFGINGKVVTAQINFNLDVQSNINNLLLQKDGKIIAIGTVGYYSASSGFGVIAKYLPNGNIDSSYGNNGFIYTDFNNKGTTNIIEGKLQSSGKLIVLGTVFDEYGNVTYYLSRYNIDGGIDSTFAKNGNIVLDVHGYSIAVQSDDKVIVCGDQWNLKTFAHAITITRLLKNGKPDSTFGINGKTSVALGTKQTFGQYPVVAIDYQERIVVGCYSSLNVESNRIVVTRFTANGFLDNSFNGTGISVGNYSDGYCFVSDIAIQHDNKIVIGGNPVFTSNFRITRFNENGKEDSSFGNDGFVTTDFTIPRHNTAIDYLNALSIQDDDKIVAVGYSSSRYTKNRFAVAMYKTNGSADSSFGFGNGKTLTNIEQFDTQANAVVIQSDGKIVAGGYSTNESNHIGSGGDFALVRYLNKRKSLVSATNTSSINKSVTHSLSIYPNPAEEIIFIKGLNTTPAQIQIIDEKGTILQNSIITNAAINISLLHAGIYYLKIFTGTNIETLKFVKFFP